MNKHSVHQITDTLGGEAIATRMGVSSHMIRHARTSGMFPSSWYAALKAMCDDVGIPCPLSAFNWRAANKVGNTMPKSQGVMQ